jgi:hypothetical protein
VVVWGSLSIKILTGVLSADFPGEASRYIEKLFDNRTVAIYSQAPEAEVTSARIMPCLTSPQAPAAPQSPCEARIISKEIELISQSGNN